MELLVGMIAGSEHLPFAIGIAFIVQLCIYFGICGSVYFITVVMHNKLNIGSLHDNRPLKPGQVRREILSSLVTCVIFACYMLVCIKLSPGVYPSSVTEGIIQVGLFLLFFDFIQYFTHRLLHTRHFRRFHRHHHDSVRVTPWTTSSFHPVEAAINQIPLVLFSLLVPVSGLMVISFYLWFMPGMAIAHSNYSPLGKVSGILRLKRYNRFHQRHHLMGDVNYGFFGTHWDFVFGTNYRGE